MIRSLLHYSSPDARRLLITELGCIVATAVLQGVAFLMLVPLLRALFLGDLATVQTWLSAMAVVAVAYAIAFWFASQIGMKASTVVLQSLLDRLGDRLVELPIAWFATDRSGLLADVATRGTMFVSSTPYAIVRLILTGFITPATVLVGMYYFDWRLALAMTATVPVMWFVFRWLSGNMKHDSDEHIEAIGDASNRVIEFARVQRDPTAIRTRFMERPAAGLHPGFVFFNPDDLQQSAPDELYRSNNKILYKFIGKNLTFATDKQGIHSLNNVNGFIPEFDINPDTLTCILNSRLMQYYYENNFFTVKVLRGNLERLPIKNIREKTGQKLAILGRNLSELPGESLHASRTRETIEDIIFHEYGFKDRDAFRLTEMVKSA